MGVCLFTFFYHTGSTVRAMTSLISVTLNLLCLVSGLFSFQTVLW